MAQRISPQLGQLGRPHHKWSHCWMNLFRMIAARCQLYTESISAGNVGDGHINAFDPATGAFLGALSDSNGNPLVIDHLWALSFGNGHMAGSTNTLFYASGPQNYAHGRFGKIVFIP